MLATEKGNCEFPGSFLQKPKGPARKQFPKNTSKFEHKCEKIGIFYAQQTQLK